MKKTKKFLSWLAAAAVICNMMSLSFAAAKRDVNDPVLREIINELSRKMPKFIDKYGETVFVEDEPITRGALISAIYEYDKRTKSAAGAVEAAPATTGSVSQITKQEFDALRTKVTALEKSGVSSSGKSQKSGGNVDMIALIADLEPNMPMLLDNSLSNSKVFKSLQQQVASGGGKAAGNVSFASVKDVSDINGKLDLLTKRVTTAESSIAGVAKAGASKDGASYAAVSKEIVNMNVKLEQISKRLDSTETNFASANKNSKIAPASAPQKEIDELKNSLAQIQQSYVKLAKRVDELNDKPLALASSGNASSGVDMSYINRQLSDIKRTVSDVPTSAEIRNEINRSKNQTQSDIERIERRLNNISVLSKSSSSGGESSGGSGSGATIATISLGITMIAALFVAR
jgi:hypothetical protein